MKNYNKIECALRMRGEARVRLIDTRLLDEAKKMHPDWDHDQIRDYVINFADYDSGWQSNTLTDLGRRTVAAGTAFGTNLFIFIHQGTTPANVQVQNLPYVYQSQSPSQIRTPDTNTFDQNALVQTRTVQFPAPSVARIINIAGLTFASAIGSSNTIDGIACYTLLSAAINQGTTQAADVQYRVTFSVET